MSAVAEVQSKLASIDYAILDVLPDQGASVGFVDIAMQVKHIATTLTQQLPPGAPKITGNTVSGRTRQMKGMGLVIDLVVTPVSDGKGFQRTPLGKEVLDAKRRRNGGH